MHGTIGTMKGCGIRPHDQPGEKCPVRRILAAIGFFLLVFGAASIGMGAAIVLSRPAWNADVAVHNNDGYLEAYARGPGRGWFALGQVSCDPQNNCAR